MIKKLGLLSTVCLLAASAQAAQPELQAENAENNMAPVVQEPSNLEQMSAAVAIDNQMAEGNALTVQPQIVNRQHAKLPNSIIVCRAKQCAPAKLSTAKEYIYNTLLHMFDSNARQKALVCAGNANTHTCSEEYLSIPIKVGVTPAYMYIDDVKIADISISQKNTMALNMLLNWGITYNGQTPVCRPSKTLLYVKNINNVIMEDNGYNCKMTTIGNTTVSTSFAIDYIDVDYGYIGGFYSIGLSGPAFGGSSGYMILRLPKDISIEAADFQVKKTEPKPSVTLVEIIEPIAPEEKVQPSVKVTKITEDAAEEVIEETEADEEEEAEDSAKTEDKKEVKSEAKTVKQSPEPSEVISAAAAATGMPMPASPTFGQYLYDAASNQYIPVQIQFPEAGGHPQYVPINSPFKPADAAPVTYAYPYAPQPMPGVAPQYMPQPMPYYGQPAQQPYGSYWFDPVSGQYLPDFAAPQATAPAPAQVPTVKDNHKPAPNVDTIIKYNHPAKQYEEAKAKAKAEAEAEAERQRIEAEKKRLEAEERRKAMIRKRKEEARRRKMEAEAIDFGGVKVFPVQSTNIDKTNKAPDLRNTLNEYNQTESRRFQ